MTKKEAAGRKRERREMAECTPDQRARDWFRRPAGVQMMIRAQAEQIREEVMQVTVRELIDRLFARIQNGELRGSDPVPADLLDDEHLDAAEYLARKYGIRSGADGHNKGTASGIPE